MTVTVTKISQPKPQKDLFTFDPDTQPGDLVMCVDNTEADTLRKGDVYTHAGFGKYEDLAVQEMPGSGWMRYRFINVHRLPDGTLAFGRGPAHLKPSPKVYTMQEVWDSPSGSLFTVTNSCLGFTHARRVVGGLLLVGHGGKEHTVRPDSPLSATWHLLAPKHSVEITYEEQA